MVLNVTPAALQRTQSKVLASCVPKLFGIDLYPLFSFKLDPISVGASHAAQLPPGLHLDTVPRHPVTRAKSLTGFSLTGKPAGGQLLVANGCNSHSNGHLPA